MRAFSIVRSRCGAVAALTAFVLSIASNSASAQGVYEGFTEPRQDILVAATEIGRLDQVFVKVGDTVHSGQPIARLEDSLQSSAVEIAKFQTTMKGELEAATAEADRSEFRTKQFRQLSADEMARPDELLRAETELRVATARVSSMQEQPQLRKLELRRAELQLLRRQVVAPAGGVISEVFHEPGEYITPGDPAIVRLLVMDKMFAVVNVPVEETNLFQVGSPARVYLRSTEKTIDANISSIAPDIDGESGTVQVRIELDNSEGTLLSGDRCTLHLLHHAKPNRKTAQRLTREPAVTIEHIGRRINR